MTSLPEQLSEARKWQFEAQLDFMRVVTTQAFASAEQVLALNINASRASVERSANTFKQLFTITDPRDLFTLGAQTQEQIQTMVDYGRELFSIASGSRLNLSRQAAAMPAPQPEQPAPAVVTAPAPAENGKAEAPAAKTVQPSKHPVVAAEPTLEAESPARAKPIAKAASKLAAKTTEVAHPSASPVHADAAVEIPPIDPVDAAPPPPPVSGTPVVEVKAAPQRAAKGNRKK